MSSNKGSKRLARLLKLIPFLQKHPGIHVADAAALFSISEEQLIADLNLIWLCGLPGYSHLELIDVSYDSGVITISNAETLARPMRLTFEEGATLLLAVENLIEIAPVGDVAILQRLRGKLKDMLGLSIEITHNVYATEVASTVMPILLRALDERESSVVISYYSATLDDYIQHTVHPFEILTMNGFAYLSGYSEEEDSHRYFRIDRIREAKSASRTKLENRKASSQAPRRNQGEQVLVAIAPSAYWFMQKWGLTNFEYRAESGAFVGEITVYNPRWLERATLSAAGALRILQSPAMQAQVVQAAHRTLERYRNPLK